MIMAQKNSLVYQAKNILLEKIVSVDSNSKILNSFFNKPSQLAGVARILLSRDESKIVYDLYDQAENNIDIWYYDIKRNVSTRLTFDPAIDGAPLWNSDGSRIYFSSNRKSFTERSSNFNVFVKNSNGSGQEEPVFISAYDKWLSDISPDDRYLLISSVNDPKTRTGWDIEILPLFGDKKPTMFLATNFYEHNAKFSPDMKWIAYQSNESGKYQVYIAAFNGKGGKWQISIDGGTDPKFIENGKKIYFITLNNKIMSVDLNEGVNTLSPGKPHEVFVNQNGNISTIYDFYKNGNKVIEGIPLKANEQIPVTFVTNWQKELEGKK